MQFTANGGGDWPRERQSGAERSSHADVVEQRRQRLQVIFLVGDAPPHMDYADDVKYPQSLAVAAEKGIVVNTIQCGNATDAKQPWQQIASIGHGKLLQRRPGRQRGRQSQRRSTPNWRACPQRSTKHVLYYGTREEKARTRTEGRGEPTRFTRSRPRLRRRVVLRSTLEAGAINAIGESELVADVASGRVDLAKVETDKLPEPLQALSVDERKRLVKENATKRSELQRQIEELADQRDDYAAKQIAAAAAPRIRSTTRSTAPCANKRQRKVELSAPRLRSTDGAPQAKHRTASPEVSFTACTGWPFRPRISPAPFRLFRCGARRSSIALRTVTALEHAARNFASPCNSSRESRSRAERTADAQPCRPVPSTRSMRGDRRVAGRSDRRAIHAPSIRSRCSAAVIVRFETPRVTTRSGSDRHRTAHLIAKRWRCVGDQRRRAEVVRVTERPRHVGKRSRLVADCPPRPQAEQRRVPRHVHSVCAIVGSAQLRIPG
jgi:hypothetical protein